MLQKEPAIGRYAEHLQRGEFLRLQHARGD